MGGKIKPVAYADVRGIGGLTPKVNATVSKEIAAFLKKELNLDSENIYITFTEVAATNWGWKGGTFG
jgi:phenylpyruvate tautomerase PptA (4-oxalocrotonate tautomerase family)